MKRLLLCLMTATLVIAPGCTKRAKIAPERMSSEQLEQEYKKYKNRGIALVATSPLPLVVSGGSACMSLALLSYYALTWGHLDCTGGIIGFGVLSIVSLGGGVYMLGQGIHDLAKAKKLRRIHMKQNTQKSKIEREAQ